MEILAGGAGCHVVKRLPNIPRSSGAAKRWCCEEMVKCCTNVLFCEEEVVHWGTVHCIMLWRRSCALWNCAFCYVVKRKQYIEKLCIALWCKEEVVHWGSVHCVILWRWSGTLSNCAFCYVVLGRSCTLWDCAWCCVSKEGNTALEAKCVYLGLGLELGQCISHVLGKVSLLFYFL